MAERYGLANQSCVTSKLDKDWRQRRGMFVNKDRELQKYVKSFMQHRAQKKKVYVEEVETGFNINSPSERTPLMHSHKKSYDVPNGKPESGKAGAKDKKKDPPGPSLLKVLVKVYGGDILFGWGCKLIYDGLQFVNPMVLK